MKNDFLIGIDIGGTDTKIGIINFNGVILNKTSINTIVQDKPELLIERIYISCQSLVDKINISLDDIYAIGLALPGILDIKNGIIKISPNMPNWIDIPFVSMFQKKLKLPCVLENDANAAAWGEKWAGVGYGLDIDSLVLITLGTGVGAGIIINNNILHGSQNIAGELGHVTIIPNGKKCCCGNYGCLEAYASATALVNDYYNHKQNIKIKDLTSKDIYNAALNNDQIAKKVFEDAGTYIGIAIVNIMHILNPDIIVIGGGMSAAKDLLINSVLNEINKRAYKIAEQFTKVVFAKLENDAGIIGAAGWALKTLEISV